MFDNLEFHTSPGRSGTEFEEMLGIFRPYTPPFESTLLNTDGQFHWSADVAAVSNCVSSWRLKHNGHTTMKSDAEGDRLYVVFPCQGAMGVVFGSQSLTALPGAALLISANLLDLGIAYRQDFHSCFTLKFDGAVLQRTLRSLFGEVTLEKLRLHPVIDLSAGSGETLYCLGRAIFGSLYKVPSYLQSSKAMTLLCEALLFHIFENFSCTLWPKSEGEISSPMLRRIKVAIDFMHANMHKKINLQDIADASHSNVRSIQAGFRQYKNMTVMAYLHQIRLAAAHAELSSMSNLLSVREVAAKWGFFHVGRFSAIYRETYGEYPSETTRLS